MCKLKQMMSTVLSMVIMVAVIGFMPSMVYAKGNVKTITIKVNYDQSSAREITSMINKFRTSGKAWYWNASDTKKVKTGKLKKLSYDYGLEKVAMQRAAEIAVQYSHTRPDGRNCFTAISDAGYNTKSMGENIAYGYTSAEDVNDGWREDDQNYDGQGHRRNMLGIGVKNPFTRVGIGHVTVGGIDFWVEEFGGNSTGAKKVSAKNGSKKVRIKTLSNRIISEDGKKYVRGDALTWSYDIEDLDNILIPLE